MKKILITGGSGFIGTNLIEFYKDKVDVLNIDIVKPRNNEHIQYWKQVDIIDHKELYSVVKEFNPDVVIHMAARTDLDGKSLEEYSANIQGVKNIIEVTNKIDNITKVIFASSRLVSKIGYKPQDELDYCPTTIYGESKVIGEKLVRENKEFSKKWILLRPTSIWGPWFDIPYKNFFTTIEKNRYVHPKNRKIHKLFGYVKNAVYIIDKLIDNDELNSRTVYLSDFEALEVNNWADLISHKFHKKNVNQVPLFILKTLANIGDLLKYIGYKNPPLTNFRLDNLLTEMLYDVEDVKNVVGELPYSLESGVKETILWMNKYD